jgi:hypothetical protein
MKNFQSGAAVSALLLALALPSFALAQSTPQTATFPITGTVAKVCSLGAVSGGSTFALGSLIDSATGQLSVTTPAAKTVTGSFCNAPSTISVSATAIATGGAAPANFTNAVNYTATASGWSSTAATVTSTGTTAVSGVAQTATTALANTITVSIGSFTPLGGPTLRPIAATDYAGEVVLTITAS